MKLKGKKVIGSALVVVVLVALPFWFWHTFVQNVPLAQEGTATIASRFDGQEPEITADEMKERARLREILSHPVTALTWNRSSRTLRMYGRDTGRAFAVNPVTLKVQVLNETRLEDFVTTLWSPNGIEVISSFEGSSESRFRYYNYSSERVSALDPSTTHIAFAPNGIRIVSTRDINNMTELWVSHPDGSNAWLLLSTRLDVMSLSWPSSDSIAVVSGEAGGERSLSLIDLQGKLRVLVTDRTDLETAWGPDGASVLVSFSDKEKSAVLRLIQSASGRELPLPLGVPATKCAWHRDGLAITCGISGFDSPAKVTAGSLSIHESVVTLDLKTYDTFVRFEPPSDLLFGIQEPVMLPGETNLAFINPFDQKPYLLSW
jgi:hypothetical protein